MKKFIWCLLFLSFSVMADEFVHHELYAINNTGGLVTITNEPCDTPVPQEGVKWWSATTQNAHTGEIIHGCWLWAEDYPAIIIHWENGTATAVTNPGAFHDMKPQLELEIEDGQKIENAI